MSYVNVGAYVNGSRPKTKKALKDALAANPASVTFDATSALGSRTGDFSATVESIGLADKLQVTGPDPYNARNWYATVQVVKGQVKIS